jgi:hypothetical protein
MKTCGQEVIMKRAMRTILGLVLAMIFEEDGGETTGIGEKGVGD